MDNWATRYYAGEDLIIWANACQKNRFIFCMRDPSSHPILQFHPRPASIIYLMSNIIVAESLKPSTSDASISSSIAIDDAKVRSKPTDQPTDKSIVSVPNGQPSQSTGDSSDILSQSLVLSDLIFGIYAIELWTYDEATGKLSNVSLGSRDEETSKRGGVGGLLLKRMTQETDPDNDYSTSEALDAFNKLTDPSRRDFLPASPTDPGVGLPGVLWAEQSSSTLGAGVNRVRRNPLLHSSGPHIGGGGGGFHSHDSIVWRDVGELANDPHQVNCTKYFHLGVRKLLILSHILILGIS